MELMLWRWSTAVQVTSCLIVMLFFAVFARTARTPDVLAWRRAWMMNATALGLTAGFWLTDANAAPAVLVRGGYLLAKLGFVAVLIEGAWSAARPALPLPWTRAWTAGLVLYATIGAVVCVPIPLLGAYGSSAIALVLLPAGVWGFRAGVPGFRWLGLGLVVRGGVAAVEGMAYAAELGWLPPSVPLAEHASVFLSASSSFDSGAEWLLALGCVLVTMQRGRHEVELANRELLAAQADLRTLADRDPLTGLLNRRVLVDVLRDQASSGGAIAFIDLDHFKQVNDLHGHEAGDAVLKAFADALRRSFRPIDAVVRYAGDEFVVVAREVDAASLEERIAALRDVAGDTRFSFGISDFPAGSDPEIALGRADARMYDSKARRRGVHAA